MSEAENEVESVKAVDSDANVKGYKLYSALKYLPVILYCVFVVLAFVAFALPVAAYNSVNSGVPADSPGNMYTALGGLLELDEHIRNVVVTSYIALGVATAYAVFAVFACLKHEVGKRKSSDLLGATFAGNLYSGCYIVYIIFAVLEVVMLSRISALDAGTGTVTVGVSVVLTLVGLGVALLCSVCSSLVRKYMETKNAALRETEQSKHA